MIRTLWTLDRVCLTVTILVHLGSPIIIISTEFLPSFWHQEEWFPGWLWLLLSLITALVCCRSPPCFCWEIINQLVFLLWTLKLPVIVGFSIPIRRIYNWNYGLGINDLLFYILFLSKNLYNFELVTGWIVKKSPWKYCR